jgi:leader peptidase (prepilin peptidase)/N-methyltransferase
VWLVVLSAYDIRHHRLPNALTLPGAAAIITAAGFGNCGPAAAVGAAALAGLYLVPHLVSPTGMGAGDVKLALGLGALTGCFGVGTWFLAAFCAPMLTLLCGVGACLLRRRGPLPHGPSMCAASVIAVLATF